MRSHTLTRTRWRAMAHRDRFEQSVVDTATAHPAITETDLIECLRGSWSAFHKSVDGLTWSFGAYDFRSIIHGLLAEGRLVKTEGQERGGGRETRYSAGEEVPRG